MSIQLNRKKQLGLPRRPRGAQDLGQDEEAERKAGILREAIVTP